MTKISTANININPTHEGSKFKKYIVLENDKEITLVDSEHYVISFNKLLLSPEDISIQNKTYITSIDL